VVVVEPSSEDEDDVPLSQRLRRRRAEKQVQKVRLGNPCGKIEEENQEK
jgi:hypothetical protein